MNRKLSADYEGLMVINYWQFFFALVALVLSFRRGLQGAVAIFIVSLPFYSVSLVEFEIGGYYLKTAELFFLVVFLIFFLSPERLLKGPALLFSFLFLLPFIVSLVVNYFHFEPIFVWEIDAEKRVDWWDKLAFKDSLGMSNITQLMYVVFSLCVFTVGANIKNIIDLPVFIGVIKWSIFLVSLIGCFQLLAYYFGIYDVYLQVFYNYASSEFNRLAFHALGGVKRVNSVFTESSVYGFYIITSLMVLFILKGVDVLKSKRVFFAVLVGLISLSGTFYVGAAVFLIFIFMAVEIKYRMIFGVLGVLVVLLLLFFVDSSFFEHAVAQKQASFDERYFYGVQLPLSNIIKSPFFGFAFGTDRPTTLLFNVVISVGIFGVLIICFAFYFIINRCVFVYLAFWGVLGFLIPDLTLYFAWLYLGAVYSYTAKVK